MKYKSIGIGAVLTMLAVAIGVTGLDQQEVSRVHQHLVATQLPIISIDTGGQALEIERVWEGEFSHKISNEIIANVKVSDTTELEMLARIKYRGNSSINFDKKSYKLNFVDDNLVEDKSHNLLGMGTHDEWVLNGPFLDKTLIRNYMCLNIAGEIMSDAPDVRFCEVFVDDEYQGVYVAMESVARSIDRVNITAYQLGDSFTSYIVRSDRQVNELGELNNFTKYARRMGSKVALNVIYPAEAKTSSELQQFIEEDLSRFEKSLYSFDYNEPEYGYEQFIDVDSFVDYFIINEFFKNYDAGTFSTYFYKDIRGKLHIGPVWDFNNACDNFMEGALDESGLELKDGNLYFMLSKDDEFIEKVIARYRQLREKWLSEEYLLNYIDETVSFLGDAIERNDEVWGYSYDYHNVDDSNRLFPLERNLGSYEEAINQLKNFIIKRGRWLDDHIETLRQYAHESKVKKFNH